LKAAGVWIEPEEWRGDQGPSYWSSNQNNSQTAMRAIFRNTNMRTYPTNTTTGATNDSTNTITRYYVRACAKF
jgi:hypothetical protein